jgi:hypothetical protein
MSGNGLHWSEEEAKRRLGKNYVPPVKKEKPHALPGPVSDAFVDRFKNQWERDYASYLEQLRHLHQIEWWAYECINLRLADNTYYRPDFLVVTENEIQIHEVKGRMRNEGLVKFKIAMNCYPFFRFKMVKKINGTWSQIYEKN